ncbi:Eukaryotic translation initiation factor 3 subunit H [Aphelenchoides bicaudatus]|nr:Eukaryotic translation initiation factor 3 subunit H [Aphelenchoides bicaudatus]
MSSELVRISECKVDHVQIDSLVIMKLVKHVDSEFYAGMSDVAGEACQGILTGLVLPSEKRLEITNCFPTPRSELVGPDTDDAAQAREQSYDEKQSETIEMLRRFRQMNIDYELVGFYQAHMFGACFTQDMLESLADYQASLSEAIVLVYDPVITRQGTLNIRALRLSPKAFDLCQLDWTPEIVKNSGINFSSVLQELPVTIKNSNLMNVMLAELRLLKPKRSGAHLELGTRNNLEKSLRAMTVEMENVSKSITSYNKYTLEKQRYDAILNTAIQKRQIENEQRAARGEPAQSIEELKRLHKPPQMQSKNGMLDLFLSSADTNSYAEYASKVTAGNIAKLFLSEAAGQSAIAQTERETPL